MIECDVIVGTRYGRMPAFAVQPEGPGPFAPVIFYMDAPGYREELKGTHHGYCFSERAEHHPEAAENAFNKLTAMWRRTLG